MDIDGVMNKSIAKWIETNPWIDRVVFQTDAAALVEQTSEPDKPRYSMSYATENKFRFVGFWKHDSSNLYQVLETMINDGATAQSIYDAVKAFQQL